MHRPTKDHIDPAKADWDELSNAGSEDDCPSEATFHEVSLSDMPTLPASPHPENTDSFAESDSGLDSISRRAASLVTRAEGMLSDVVDIQAELVVRTENLRASEHEAGSRADLSVPSSRPTPTTSHPISPLDSHQQDLTSDRTAECEDISKSPVSEIPSAIPVNVRKGRRPFLCAVRLIMDRTCFSISKFVCKKMAFAEIWSFRLILLMSFLNIVQALYCLNFHGVLSDNLARSRDLSPIVQSPNFPGLVHVQTEAFASFFKIMADPPDTTDAYAKVRVEANALSVYVRSPNMEMEDRENLLKLLSDFAANAETAADGLREFDRELDRAFHEFAKFNRDTAEVLSGALSSPNSQEILAQSFVHCVNLIATKLSELGSTADSNYDLARHLETEYLAMHDIFMHELFVLGDKELTALTMINSLVTGNWRMLKWRLEVFDRVRALLVGLGTYQRVVRERTISSIRAVATVRSELDRMWYGALILHTGEEAVPLPEQVNSLRSAAHWIQE